jgi:uncharacterized protein
VAEAWQRVDSGIILSVRATPKGVRNRIEGIWQDAAGARWLAVRVSVPPAEGAANAAIIDMLCRQFFVKKQDVMLVSGTTSRLKRFNIAGDPDVLGAIAQKFSGIA